MLPDQKLDALVARYKAVEAELASRVTSETYVKLSREFAELGPIVKSVTEYRSVEAEIAGINSLLKDPTTDAEMCEMASAEKPGLEEKRLALEREIKVALLPSAVTKTCPREAPVTHGLATSAGWPPVS